MANEVTVVPLICTDLSTIHPSGASVQVSPPSTLFHFTDINTHGAMMAGPLPSPYSVALGREQMVHVGFTVAMMQLPYRFACSVNHPSCTRVNHTKSAHDTSTAARASSVNTSSTSLQSP